MKKILLFLMLALFCVPWAANAQNTLTVCDGTVTNQYVPIYGYWADASQHNQMIYPSSYLEDMIGQDITKMVFYLSSGLTGNDIGTWTIKLGETEATTLTGLDGTTALTQVYSGPMTFDTENSTMTITFTDGFNYHGGNLLVDFTHSSASWRSMTFYGIEAASASVNQYSTNSASVRDFLPKNTFTYEVPASCPKPTSFAVTANGQSATLTWESDASSFDVAYSTTDNVVAAVTAATYTMNDLTIDEDHTFYVRAHCGSETSDWAGPISVHVGYCTPNPISVDNDGITNVTFGMGDNIVNNNTTNDTYADYSSLIGAVQAGVEATIEITYATSYTYNTYVWVDLDNSLSFDADEVVCYGESSSSSPDTLTLSFVIPTNQTLGDYRMRIGGADSGLGSDPDEADPCYSEYYAAFQDYTLRVLEAPSCLIPTGLQVITDGETATATWEGTAETYNIDIDGTVIEGVTTPYEFEVELSTTYAVKVQANCAGDETSEWGNTVNFTTPACLGGHQIEYTLTDSYGDGWNGASITFVEGCDQTTLTVNSNYSTSGTLNICGDYFAFIWNSGSYDSECGFTFTENGTTLFTKPSSITDGQVLYTFGETFPVPTGLTAGTPGTHEVELSWTENAEATAWQICVNGDEENLIDVTENPYTLTGLTSDADYTVKVRSVIDATTQTCWSEEETFHTAVACPIPENLAEAEVSNNSATLSWEGTSDSYVLQYRTAAQDFNINAWEQVGNDLVATGVLTQYTFDLSGFEGTGAVAIRHYNVSDMFYLDIDNIVVTNAAGNEVVNEDFEAGSLSEDWIMLDLDGDGYNWEISDVASGLDANENPYGYGDYLIRSASYLNYVGAVTPDNWLIIPNVELGGTMTLWARGQDPSWAGENFGVFVTTESLDPVPAGEWVIVENATSPYTVEDLNANTPYEWQVKGFCGEEESSWATSTFNTIPEGLKTFVTDGNWDEDNNWFPVGVPTIEDEVIIEANAIVPAGVIAVASRATINAGSITIKDGGQLKQGAATLKVTFEKEIAGYGDNAGGYNLIASPFSGTTQLYNTSTWNCVSNLTSGDYDFYTFVPSDVSAEWNNYKLFSDEFSVMSYGNGYLYANEEDHTLIFKGTVVPTFLNNGNDIVGNIITETYTYDETSTDLFNGWALVGNPFSCNAYINYLDAESDWAPFDVYVLNEAGDGFVLTNSNMLAPLTAAFIKVSESGTIQYSTEPLSFSSASSEVDVPCLPAHGRSANQRANCACEKIVLNESNEYTYFEDFEDMGAGITKPFTGVMPDCWTLVAQYTGAAMNEIGDGVDTLPQLFYNPDFDADGGDYTLRMKFHSLVAMPELDETVDLSRLHLSLYVRQPQSYYHLQVGILEDLDDDSTFEPLAMVDNETTDMEYFECDFSRYTGTGRYIAFKNVGGSKRNPYCSNYLDNITLTYAPAVTCGIEIPADYQEGFEGYATNLGATGVEPECWEVITPESNLDFSTKPQVFAGFNTTTGGDFTLRMRNRCVYAMPEFAEDVDITALTMTFNLRQPKAVYRLQVGVVDANGNFEMVEELNNATADMEPVSVDFSGYTGSGNRIAFRNVLNGKHYPYSYNYIDDIAFVPSAKSVEASGDVNDAMDNERYLANISVYPNPTTGMLYIDAVNVQKVECYNQMGQLVGVYDNENELNLGELSNGVYMLRITVPQGVTMRKVVKR